MDKELEGLEYGFAILAIFDPMFEPWMDDQDKAELIALTLQSVGKTLADIDAEIASGVANGYSVEQQIAICRTVFSS